MTTIASPRPSLTLSSRRTSISTETPSRADSVSHTTGAPGQRRNRAALREFYGLKNNTKPESTDTLTTDEDLAPRSELDKPNFDADAYAHQVLSRDGLEGILKVEAGLLRDIRSFDGEKKALVYDNYSKLIAATETIRKMRGNMDPLRPAFTALNPALLHIVETAKSISNDTGAGQDAHTDQQRRTVKYVLESPDRLRKLMDETRLDEAKAEWAKVSALLDRWQGISGESELRARCNDIMQGNT